MTEMYLLLGSNIGDREEWLRAARQAIETSIGDIGMASALYETAAWGKEDQAAFLNQALLVHTTLSPEGVLEQTTTIEIDIANRLRIEKWAPRTLDIDILFYGDTVMNTSALVIPHPALQLRRFALEPLCELAPHFRHPVLNKSVEELLEQCPDPLQVNLFTAA